MKKSVFILLLSPFFCFSQFDNSLNILSNNLSIFWQNEFIKDNKTFLSPSIFYFSKTNPINTDCGYLSEMNCFYCSISNQIFYSSDMYKYINNNFNNGVNYMILAHEYGHAVQFQYGNTQMTSIMKELQADCFAGVFMSSLNKNGLVSNYDIYQVHKFYNWGGDESTNLASLLDHNAHGTPQARITAFDGGFKATDFKYCISEFDLDGALNGLFNSIGDLFKKDTYRNEAIVKYEPEKLNRISAFSGDVIFFTKEDLGQIKVFIEGVYKGTIDNYFPINDPFCDETQILKLHLPEGTYNYYSITEYPKKREWKGKIEVKRNSCLRNKLTK